MEMRSWGGREGPHRSLVRDVRRLGFGVGWFWFRDILGIKWRDLKWVLVVAVGKGGGEVRREAAQGIFTG